MRLRHLVCALRSALHVSKIPCELSNADLESMIREGIDDVGDRRRVHPIVECALTRARHVCEEMRARHEAAAEPARPRSKRTRRRSRKEKRR